MDSHGKCLEPLAFLAKPLPPTNANEVNLADVRSTIRSGDLLLFRGRGLASRLISLAGRSCYTHAARVVRWGVDLFCCEVREGVGGRAVTLESQVARYPGQIDVFETNPDGRFPRYDRPAADRYMRRLAGCQYGWGGIAKTALLRIPFLRSLATHDFSDASESKRPPFCSQAVAMAERAGGVDVVPNLPDRFTEPGDLARSNFYRYRFTLES